MKKPRYLLDSGVFNARKGLTGGLGRNRKTRPKPYQYLHSKTSQFLGYTFGYTRLRLRIIQVQIAHLTRM